MFSVSPSAGADPFVMVGNAVFWGGTVEIVIVALSVATLPAASVCVAVAVSGPGLLSRCETGEPVPPLTTLPLSSKLQEVVPGSDQTSEVVTDQLCVPGAWGEMG